VILDDVHKARYREHVKATLRQLGYPCYSLWPYTLDEFGRYSFLTLIPARKQPK